MDEASDRSAADRRALLTKGGVAAAVAAATAVGFGRQVDADDGLPLTIGQPNTGTATTALSGGSSIVVTDGTTRMDDVPGSVIGLSSLSDGSGIVGARTGPGFGAGVAGANYFPGGIGAIGGDLGGGNQGYGIFGFSDGTGVGGSGAYDDLRADGSGRLTLAAAGVTSPPDAFGETGMLARDEAGELWYCFGNRWRKVAGASTGGAFHPISPVRVYDSRLMGGVPLFPHTDRVVSVADGRDVFSGALTQPNVVPSGATAVTYNLTVTGTGEAGWLFIAPATATAVTASSINWTLPGTTAANGGTVQVDLNRNVRIFCGPGLTHAIVDVSGYYI